MSYPQNQSRTAQSAPRASSAKNNVVIAAAIVLSALILGICLIIASSILGNRVKKLTEAVEKQTFTSSFSAPSNLTVRNTPDKKYFTEAEAAEYLNMTADDIRTAVKSGDIDEYIKTDNGYVISRDKLDSYFESEAYNTRIKDNS